jgi:D-xylonolactonase
VNPDRRCAEVSIRGTPLGQENTVTSITPPLETLASGFGLVEGPRVDDQNRLLFSDAKQGGVYRRDSNGTIETIVPKRRGVGGIALHADGGIVCSGRNICHVKDGETRIVFAVEGVPGFNDIFTDDAGRVYAGSQRFDPFAEKPTAVPGEMYRIESEGKATQLYDDVGLSNGIGFSPDGRILYHSDSTAGHVIVHDLESDGRCANRRALAGKPRGMPDGLAVDEEGCIWVAMFAGGCAARLTPAGDLDRQIDVPAEQVASLCFGGADLRDLYIVTADNRNDVSLGGTVFRTRVEVPGLPAPLARV